MCGCVCVCVCVCLTVLVYGDVACNVMVYARYARYQTWHQRLYDKSIESQQRKTWQEELAPVCRQSQNIYMRSTSLSHTHTHTLSLSRALSPSLSLSLSLSLTLSLSLFLFLSFSLSLSPSLKCVRMCTRVCVCTWGRRFEVHWSQHYPLSTINPSKCKHNAATQQHNQAVTPASQPVPFFSHCEVH
jgi:hypothetical protein